MSQLISDLIVVLIIVIPIAWKIYEFRYYRSNEFSELKGRIDSYIQDCNELNHHIESLKDISLISNQRDYGEASYHDASRWNYKRKHLKNTQYASNVYDCSRSVCDSARKKPFEYICKYFGIKATEESLSDFEEILNNFEAVEEGKKRLQNEKDRIISSIQTEIPSLIKKFSKKKLEKKLGFEPIDMRIDYFPKYTFRYTSPGGNKSYHYDVDMNIDRLNRFILFLSEKIKFRNSIAGQRALMTSKLREHIKKRDDYTCQICGASMKNEPNLLLEIDHIIPVSKGGLTTEENLQTLCWRCNRRKGAKLS